MRFQGRPAKAILAAMIAVGACNVAVAQSFPTKPVRIVTTPAGGGNDFAARLVAGGMSSGLGQSVIVENRPANLAGDLVAKAAPDGYTLIVTGNFLWIAPLMRTNPSYDPVRDFAPISLLATSPNVLVVHPSVDAASVKELIALARAKPRVLNYGMTGIGTANHTAAELFKSMAGVDIVSVNYKGAGAATTDLLAGQVQVMFASVTSVVSGIKAGKLKALGVTGSSPSSLLPGVPTISSAGLPGYEAESIFGAFAPGGTPDAIVGRISREIVQFLKTPDPREKMLNAGMEVVGSGPAQLGAVVKSEVARLGKVIKDAGIRLE